eukprot:scaffold70425_cov68-Phaeocystis_antarctica.AAC.3
MADVPGRSTVLFSTSRPPHSSAAWHHHHPAFVLHLLVGRFSIGRAHRLRIHDALDHPAADDHRGGKRSEMR